MKGRKAEKFWDKISSTGFKWSNLNAPSTETPVSHSLLSDSLFPIFSSCSFLPSSLCSNKKRELPVRKVGRWKNVGTKQLNRLEMVQFECPKYRNPCVLFILSGSLFPIFSSCSFHPSSLYSNKKRELPV